MPRRPLPSAVLPVLLALALLGPGLAGSACAQAPAAPAAAADPLAAPPAADSLAAAADSLATVAAPARTLADYEAEIRGNFTPESRRYANTRGLLALLDPLYAVLVALVLLATGASARMRDLAHGLGPRRYLRVLAYFTMYAAVGFALAFPFAWYQGFALEHQYGLSNQTFGAWLREEFIGLVVSIAFLGVLPLVALAYRAIEGSPKRWWLWLAAGTFPVIIAAMLVTPYVEMLTNKFTPLRDASLKQEIVTLAGHAGIPGRNVYEVDRSRQTRKFNAYVTGFGTTQRIVLWDTTLQGMRRDEILFVMGHEMGHYVLRHIWKGILVFSLLSVALFGLAKLVLDALVARFGARWRVAAVHDLAAMPLLAAVLSVLSFAAQPVVNGFSRSIERESDVFALEVTRLNDAGARAFIKLGSQNRADPDPPAWRVWLQYSHPPLLERVRFAATYRPWETGAPHRAFRGTPYTMPVGSAGGTLAP